MTFFRTTEPIISHNSQARLATYPKILFEPFTSQTLKSREQFRVLGFRVLGFRVGGLGPRESGRGGGVATSCRPGSSGTGTLGIWATLGTRVSCLFPNLFVLCPGLSLTHRHRCLLICLLWLRRFREPGALHWVCPRGVCCSSSLRDLGVRGCRCMAAITQIHSLLTVSSSSWAQRAMLQTMQDRDLNPPVAQTETSHPPQRFKRCESPTKDRPLRVFKGP